MSLSELVLENVRSLTQAELHLHPQRNLVWGLNGTGKTSLLEAIFLLGRGRSFRTRNSEKLIRHGQERLYVFGRTETGPEHSVGVMVSRRDGTTAKVDGSFVSSLADLSHAFPVQVIDPGIHKLVEEGANRRRRWMDWMVFHVEQEFIHQWTQYTRALKQRNAALRTQPDQAAAWDPEVIRLGEALAAARGRLIDQLQPFWTPIVGALTGLEVEMSYSRGWAQDMSLAEALDASRARDRLRGMTHVGPHRADVILKVGGQRAREVLSRGQQKLVAAAMALSQLALLQATSDVVPTLLLDDPAAELDNERLGRFLEQVAALRCQLIFTALSPDSRLLGAPDRVFHVEQGGVRSL